MEGGSPVCAGYWSTRRTRRVSSKTAWAGFRRGGGLWAGETMGSVKRDVPDIRCQGVSSGNRTVKKGNAAWGIRAWVK